MAVFRALVGAIPLFFLAVGLAGATTGVLEPTGEPSPVAGTLLVVVGLALLVSLWLVGWWTREASVRE
jgi:hypothetical protein